MKSVLKFWEKIMTKRFADTEIWNKDWYLDLTLKQKLLLKYIYDNCDCAGVYEISYRNLKNCFGEEVAKSDFDGLKQIKFIDENKIFIEDFIEFQYGWKLESLNAKNNNIQKGIIKSLTKHKLLPNPCARVLDKDKDKDNINYDIKNNKHDILNNQDNIEKDNESNKKFENFDLKSRLFEQYENLCPNLIRLTGERKSRKIAEKMRIYLDETDSDMEMYENLCRAANKLRIIADRPIDFETMLNCRIGILNGKYLSKTALEQQKIKEKAEREIKETLERNEQIRNFQGDPMPESFKKLKSRLLRRTDAGTNDN